MSTTFDGITRQQVWDETSAYGDVILELDGNGAPINGYTLAGNRIVAQTDANHTASYFLQDALGSTRGLTSGSTVTQAYSYDAFGTLLGDMGSLATNYLFAGQQYDSATGLYSMRARYYDPGVGRFLSRDTWAINYANPVELNRYAYAANNPVRWSDPSGNNFIESIKLRIGAISASVTTGLVALREAVTNAIDRVLIRFNLFWEQVCAAFQNTTNNIVVRVGEGAVANYTKVRQIMHGEILDDIIDELKAMTWQNNVEYAVVRFTDNTRWIVSGGQRGIVFDPTEANPILRLIMHTHPYGLLQAGLTPSPGDLDALRQLGQATSWLIGNGEIIKFTLFGGQ